MGGFDMGGGVIWVAGAAMEDFRAGFCAVEAGAGEVEFCEGGPLAESGYLICSRVMLIKTEQNMIENNATYWSRECRLYCGLRLGWE